MSGVTGEPINNANVLLSQGEMGMGGGGPHSEPIVIEVTHEGNDTLSSK